MRRGVAWGRALAIAIAALLALGLRPAIPAAAQSFTHAVVVQRDGDPTLLVDGRPFFFYGAAFFYERMPPTQWRASMLALKTLGFNTLDLYVPWNWHETADGAFDFDGHTNPARNVRAVLALARELDFYLVVRPGPVIRNEWRNGGYPAWLLRRPDYAMPLHDILEGRYPSTATLQNAHADDAAAEWMRNATHMRYASRWLTTALREFAPVADRVIAVQLDDDQGAYIDNQTWPAPHLATYLRTLASVVRSVVGPQLPLFINTYEMKVTASAPVWAMGNWYQSDAEKIGEHDRAALEFSTGLLQTQPNWPVAISEFQAGWLAAPEDPTPRPADPTNTTLALHTILGMGARGVIDFPAQDTRNPAGWEAPFANASYAWDAALDVHLRPSARYAPTLRFGELVTGYGSELAQARRVADGAIAYLTSSYPEDTMTNPTVFAIAARTQDAQHACRARRLTCDLVDLRFIDDARLRRYPFLVVPTREGTPALTDAVRLRLARYRAGGGIVMTQPPADVSPANGGIADATLLIARDGAAFLDIVNYDDAPRTVPAARIPRPHGGWWTLAPRVVAARDAVLLRLDGPQSPLPTHAPQTPPIAPARAQDTPPATVEAAHPASVTEFASPRDGFARLRLANGHAAVTISPAAGARAVAFIATLGGQRSRNFFTSVGGLRDDVDVAPPVSTKDRIGKYTRSFPAGTFNRTYAVERLANAGQAAVRLTYAAPDVVPNGAVFERTVSLPDDATRFVVDERVTFGDGPDVGTQRAVRYDSFDTHDAAVIDDRANGAIGFYVAATHIVAILTWRSGDVEDVQIVPERSSTVARLRFAPGGVRRTVYAADIANTLDDARAAMRKERDRTNAKR